MSHYAPSTQGYYITYCYQLVDYILLPPILPSGLFNGRGTSWMSSIVSNVSMQTLSLYYTPSLGSSRSSLFLGQIAIVYFLW